MKTNNQIGMFWVIATLTVAIVPQVASMPAQLVPLVILPILWRLLAEFRGWRPAHLLVRMATTALTVFFLVATYGTLIGRRAAVSLLTLMMALKLLETFRVRDARIVTSLCLFLCATQFLFSQGISMLFYGGTVVVLALMAMVLLQRREAYTPRGMAPPSGFSMLSELGYSTKLLAMAIPVALALFMFFPRWGSPLWGVPESSLDAKSGLSESMSPGSIQNLFMDDSPAFRADFEGPIPRPDDMYWRGPVFWDFDGLEWHGTYYSRNLPADGVPEESADSWRYTVQMEPTEQHWMFALDYPTDVPHGAKLTMDYQLYSRRSITQLRNYRIVSNPQFTDSPSLLNTHRSNALHLPEGYNPRTASMVADWRKEITGNAEFVDRVLRHFNQQNFRYTFNPPLLSTHSVDEFLFETRSGFCEHYASAFTVMMRMAGIPARVVTGYQGGWYNEFGKYVLVRQSDAHAWSEVWLPESGWTRVDPTAAVAPSRVERGALDALGARRYLFDYQWLRAIKNGFDLIQRGWNQWVIAFNFDRQMNMLKPFGLGQLSSTQLVAIMVALIGMVGLALLPLLSRIRLSGGLDAAGREWLAFRKKLEAAGIQSSAAMTPAELLRHAGQDLPGHARELARITRLYTEIRYAPEGPEVAELKSAVACFRPLKKAS